MKAPLANLNIINFGTINSNRSLDIIADFKIGVGLDIVEFGRHSIVKLDRLGSFPVDFDYSFGT